MRISKSAGSTQRGCCGARQNGTLERRHGARVTEDEIEDMIRNANAAGSSVPESSHEPA
jgi:hypothetical protein